MPGLKRAARWLPLLVSVIFVIVNLVNAIRKAGDLKDYLDAGGRLLTGASLYAGSSIAYGFVGPPAQALLFAPFAPMGEIGGRVAWYIVSLGLLWYALRTWVDLLVPSRGAPAAPHAGAGVFGSRVAILSLIAVAHPLQTQFEHQNLNVILLALAAFAGSAIRDRRPGLAGAALGVMAAAKIYPAILLGWLGLRGQWRALASGVAVALGVSILPALFRGFDGFVGDVNRWLDLAGAGWPVRRANQSLAAMWGRYLLGEPSEGYGMLTFQHPMVLWLVILSSLAVLVPLAVAWWRHRASPGRLVEEIACVNALAVLLSPIAWEHYWLAFYPVFLALGVRAWDAASSPAERSRLLQPRFWAASAFWIGLVGITLLSRPIVGAEGARVVRDWSVMTWCGLLACATLAALLARRASNPGKHLT